MNKPCGVNVISHCTNLSAGGANEAFEFSAGEENRAAFAIECQAIFGVLPDRVAAQVNGWL